MIRVAGIVNDSIVDGPGLRLTVYAQGCRHNCKHCHNPETHDFTGGTEMSADDIIRIAERNPLLSGITLSGGEPFLQAEELSDLAKLAKDRGMDVYAYTGYTWEELMEPDIRVSAFKLLEYVDVLIDGRFVEELKSYDLVFRGSSNQRMIDVRESLERGSAVEVY